MATFTRKNAWNDGGTFNNQDLLWYAKGVGALQSRGLDDQNSWWFFAAIHGEYVNPDMPWYTKPPAFPDWGFIPGPPNVPTTPLPSDSLQELYWNQCQHQSWYFPPWHRGYLLVLEAQVRAAVMSLGGPSDWALPYWNYFGPGDEYKIPRAFTQPTLDGEGANPLFVKARYGPKFDGDIYVTSDENQDCQNDTFYTNSYGGPETKFSHSGGDSGDLESNPHNGVHVDVGGMNNSQTVWGLMSDPGMAALDPIFYLHHANIDRMWASWNENGNSNPTDLNWVNGPVATGDREFAMPMPDGTSWVYTPADVNSLGQLDYTYDDLTMPVLALPSNALAQRLMKLGVVPAAAQRTPGRRMNLGAQAELVGAHDAPLRIGTSGARATVRLDPQVQRTVSASLEKASELKQPDHVYLRLENVRGNIDAYKLHISVNQQRAGTVALFGLRRASQTDGEHAGEGLTFALDISNIVDNLFLANNLDVNALDVRIEPNHAVPDNAELTVGRVGIYRQAQP